MSDGDHPARHVPGDVIEWRYLPGGRVKHGLSSVEHRGALCGAAVPVAAYWLGTGSQREYEIAEAMLHCARCVAIVGQPATGEDR